MPGRVRNAARLGYPRGMSLRRAAPALLAALLFGASTPVAKLLGAEIPPLLLAGLLYVGSGVGLGVLLLARRALGARDGGAQNAFDPQGLRAVRRSASAGFGTAGQGLTIEARVQPSIRGDIIYIMRTSTSGPAR